MPRTGKVYSAGIHGGDARLHAVTDHTGGLSCTQGVANVYNPAYLGNETKICKLFFESDF